MKCVRWPGRAGTSDPVDGPPADPALRLDPTTFAIGGGIASWTRTTFDVARLEISEDGVHADVRFTTRDGAVVEVRVDDRDGRRRRRRARLLAPVGATIQHPRSLLLVFMTAFDLLRAVNRPPHLAIGGRPVSTGALPGARLHRRRLVKCAAGLVAVTINAEHDGPAPAVDPAATGDVVLDGRHITELSGAAGEHTARLAMTPAVPGRHDGHPDVQALAADLPVAWHAHPRRRACPAVRMGPHG